MTTLHCILTLENAITFAVQTISSVLEAVLVLKHTCRTYFQDKYSANINWDFSLQVYEFLNQLFCFVYYW